MWIQNMTQTQVKAPAMVVKDGFNVDFGSLTREEKDALGWNEYIPITREPYHTYVTHDEKGADLIVRQIADSDVVDEAASDEALANTARARRDALLKESDFTQLADAPAAIDKAAWATYRQALRDVPGQEGFPRDVAWPVEPV